MYTIRARNVNDAYVAGAGLLAEHATIRQTRNGPAYEMPEPVTTRYERPMERVLFSPSRDANPFFHLLESLWMLAGRNDVAWMKQWLPSLVQFSDHGHTFHGAYGARWRHWPMTEWDSWDQLPALVNLLQRDPDSRRAVLGIWDPARDLGANSLDIPCNLAAKFEARDEALHLYVFNRSNDIIWGAYGANAVQFSMLQEYVAARLGMTVGVYEQISTNFHAYLSTWERHQPDQSVIFDLYQTGDVKPLPLVSHLDYFQVDLSEFLRRWEPIENQDPGYVVVPSLPLGTYSNTFFPLVAEPMAAAARVRKAPRSGPETAMRYLSEAQSVLQHNDWLRAGMDWLHRREKVHHG